MTAGMIEGFDGKRPKGRGRRISAGSSEPTPETNQRVPTRRHPLFGALKGYVQVMPGTDLTEPTDPAWGDGDPPKM
jgi:hypothetical protein